MFGLLGTFGLEIVAFTVGGIYLGHRLDAHYGSDPLWLIICTLGGLVVGILSAIYTLKTFVKD
jgi:F0F1-type ATP synthase assembly protein I